MCGDLGWGWDERKVGWFGLGGGAGNKTKDRRFYRSFKVSSSAQPDLAEPSNDRGSNAAALPRIVTAGTGSPLSIRRAEPEVSFVDFALSQGAAEGRSLLLGGLFYFNYLD